MTAPALAVEPPTPQENAFQFVDVSNSTLGISKLQARFESPLKSFNFQNPRGVFHSSQPQAFPVSSGSYTTDYLASPFLYPNPYNDHTNLVYPKGLGVPIARSNVKGHIDATTAGRKISRHHRDLSGTSSSSSLSGPLYDASPPAIDPSALQPPLSKYQTEPVDCLKSEINQVISPFINQVVEHGPDGTITGRYSRPLTSTGRPSHARKTPPGHVKRPRNAFILFRSHACSSNLIPPTVEKDHRQISRIVSHMWKSLPAEEKIRWEREAEAEKELHRKLHPDYRYKPIYRKENPGKTDQAGLSSSSPMKKKHNNRKKIKGMNQNVKGRGGVSEDLESCATVCMKSSIELLQERDEEIRCEVVAKILMETKLSGITLDESQMEERVLEQLRLAKTNDAIQSQIKSQSDVESQNGQIDSSPHQNSKLNSLSISESGKPKNNTLAPLQARRKSLANRSNSAPPPPSPLRMMHVREVVYNPKARGSRELSPDFPKPRLVTSDEEMKFENVPYSLENFTPEVLFTGSFHPLQTHNDLNPFLELNKGETYYHYQCNPTPSQELEQLFHSPEFSFADENCLQSNSNNISKGFFNSPTGDQDDYPIFNGLFTETKINYHKTLAVEGQPEIRVRASGNYSFTLDDPLARLPSDSKSREPTPTSGSTKEEKYLGNSIVCHERPPKEIKMDDRDSANRLNPNCINRRPSLNIFAPSMRRKSSVVMTLAECTSPKLVEALELAKQNLASLSGHTEKFGHNVSEISVRRKSVVLAGLGEFPIMNFPLSHSEIDIEKRTDNVWSESLEDGTNRCLPDQSSADVLQPTNQGPGENSFVNFVNPFKNSAEISTGRIMNSSVGFQENKEPSTHQYGTSVASQCDAASTHEVKHGLPGAQDNGNNLSQITFDSAIGADGQTYLFLTKEQAETEGLIGQILEAGFGVTYETDIPDEET